MTGAAHRHREAKLFPEPDGWIRRHLTLLVLGALPLVIFGLPLLWGHAFLDSDNFLQNFPLRVLVGTDLRQGHLPLADPYLFGGTPLLAGFNAGAAYPGTWLFAILPGQVAWTLNLAATYDIALFGMYAFLRREGLVRPAATMGAATFSFAGYMAGQMVHIDLIGGAAWLPWVLVAVHGLTPPIPSTTPSPDARRLLRRHRLKWMLLLALATGMSATAGAPEAMLDGGLLVGIYLVARLRSGGYLRRQRLSTLAGCLLPVVGGVSWGAVLAAAQLAPGLAFTAVSQRAGTSYGFFTSFSLPGKTVPLLASPFLLGTNQNQPAFYTGEYNFPEVTSYVGILALIAAAALLGPRWRRHRQARSFGVWYVVLVVGVLSALGGATPFAHLLYAIPGVNRQRLLNRNILLVDLSLAVLSAWWMHLLLVTKQQAPGDLDTGPVTAGPWQRGRRIDTVLTCLPLGVVAILACWLWIWGTELQRLLGGAFAMDTATRLSVAGLATAGVVVAGAGTWLALSDRRLSIVHLRRALMAVLMVDVALFDFFVVRPPVPLAAAHAQTAPAAALTVRSGSGRFLIYDPDLLDESQLDALGGTDLNVLRHLSSGQGYAALVSQDFYQATGAHEREHLDPATLAGSVWDQLNVHALLSLPSYFVTPERGSPVVPTFPVPTPPSPGTGAPAPTAVTLVPGSSRTWYFGGTLTIGSAGVPVTEGDPGTTRVGLISPSGAVQWLSPAAWSLSPVVNGSTLAIRFAHPERVAGLAVQNLGGGPITLGTPVVHSSRDGTLLLDGPLQDGVVPPHWQYNGMIGSFGVFTDTRARGWAWAGGATGGPPPPGTSVTSGAPLPDGSQRISAHITGPTVLVRSATWSTGWQATARPSHGGGPVVRLVVSRSGIAQKVTLARPGDYVVTFTYHPGLDVGAVALSALGTLALMATALAMAQATRRRRRHSVRKSPQPGPRRPMASAARR